MTKRGLFRQAIYNKHHGHCAYCGKSLLFKELVVDHLIPKVSWQELPKSETIGYENYMPACRTCNTYKSNYSLEEFRKWLVTLHERIEKKFLNKVAINYKIITLEPFNGQFYFESLQAQIANCESCKELGWTCAIHDR